MKAELFRKPSWDKTNDPTIDPTLLDPATGLPVNGRSVESLSKRHLFTADEWEAIMVAAGLQQPVIKTLEIKPESILPTIQQPVIHPITLTPEEKKAEKARVFKERMARGRAEAKAKKEAESNK